MSLSANDLSQLSRLLDQALDLPAGEVPAWLAALPAEQAHLAAKLREMLEQRASTRGATFLASGPQLASDEAVARAGEPVGPWRLLREIGRGGMGSVWLAERADGAFERQVALKLPRLAWAEGLAERMARERRIGALLEHSHIARLYDAGLDARGRPFIAMEYIDGVAIDAWVRQQGLDPRATLKLMLQVIRPVAYAHGRLVVHRDLKPSNVLVSADGQAHLLDFGIAKLLGDGEAGPDARLTQEQGRVMTLHYAAPEQIAGQAVGVQADVYSLGVLLYELLTSCLPHERGGAGAGAIEAAILTGDFPPASARVKDKGRARALRGELDAVLAKALQPDLDQRYATADAMADDLERYLGGRPVKARHISLAARWAKAARRNWVAVSATAAVLLTVLTGSAVAVVQANRAARAAERERVVKAFVADVFRLNSRPDRRSTALRPASSQELLSGGAELIRQRFTGQPELQAELYGVVGGLFSDMGAFQLAAEYATRRVETLGTLGADRQEQARAMLALAQALFDQRRHADAELRVLRALSLAAGDLALQAEALVLRARIQAQVARGEPLEATLKTLESMLVGDAGRTYPMAMAWASALRASNLSARNRLDEAKPLYETAIAAALKAEGEEAPAVIAMRQMYASRLVRSPDYPTALHHHRAAMQALRSKGELHTVQAIMAEAQFARSAHAWPVNAPTTETIETLDARLAELSASSLPIPRWMGAYLRMLLGDVHCEAGNVEAGWGLVRSVESDVRAAATTPADRFRVLNALAMCAYYAGEHQIADRLFREVPAVRIQLGQQKHPWASGDFRMIASNLMMAGDVEGGLRVLDDAPPIPDMVGEAGKSDRYARAQDLDRALLHLAAGRPSVAMEWLRRARADDADPVDQPDYDVAQGEVLCALGQWAAGRRLVQRYFVAELKLDRSPHRPWLARARSVAGLCALGIGDRSSARRFAEQARAAFTAQPGVSPYYKAPLIELERKLGLRLPPV